jgi:hypothetical protein
MDQSFLPFLYVVSQKMIPHFYVLGFGMKHWVLCMLMCHTLKIPEFQDVNRKKKVKQ